jgi:para-nitrobenzyl esterase
MKLHPQKLVILFAMIVGTNAADAQSTRPQAKPVQQQTADGILQGVVSPDGKVRTFKSIPYAAPPVGPLRWKPPQPVIPWTGVRQATDYPPRAMQGHIWDDMFFYDKGPSEDCLYLNLWMPEVPRPAGLLPVMVWIHGGGFIAGATSEPRQDAGNLSKKGVLVVSMNYRMGVFGFLSLPELTKESPENASGNYGLLDQVAALQWVRKNIVTFGGDPNNITIFGESAGSLSVSALMASPLSQGLFQKAIGESGAFFGTTTLPLKPRAVTEAAGVKFTQAAFKTTSLADLRAKPAQEILDAALKQPNNYFAPNIDGYFLSADCQTIYAAGKQSHVPLLAGWNLDEQGYKSFFGNQQPTLVNYNSIAKTKFGGNADAFLKVYSATTDAQAKRAGGDFAGDKFIAYSTWKWLDMHLQTGQSPVYRYKFEQTLPLTTDAKPGTEAIAAHSWEIEYVFRVLTSKKLPWWQSDRDVSELMSTYWTNFARTGDPNGTGLPTWPAYTKDGYQVMHLQAQSAAAADIHRDRYEFLDEKGFGQ